MATNNQHLHSMQLGEGEDHRGKILCLERLLKIVNKSEEVYKENLFNPLIITAS